METRATKRERSGDMEEGSPRTPEQLRECRDKRHKYARLAALEKKLPVLTARLAAARTRSAEHRNERVAAMTRDMDHHRAMLELNVAHNRRVADVTKAVSDAWNARADHRLMSADLELQVLRAQLQVALSQIAALKKQRITLKRNVSILLAYTMAGTA